MIQERTRIQRIYRLLDESNYPYVGDTDRKEFEIDYSGQNMTIGRTLVSKSSWDEMDKPKYNYYIIIGDKTWDKYYDEVPRMLKQLKGEKYEDGGELSKHLAPNGKPSNLTPEQYKLVRTKAFKDWFGDWENDPSNASKVVDFNGEPLVVFHGTSASFNTFKEEEKGRRGGLNEKFWSFTTNIEQAKIYALDNRLYGQFSTPKIIPVFLNIKEMPTYDNQGRFYRELKVWGGYKHIDIFQLQDWHDRGFDMGVEFKKVDGFCVKNTIEMEDYGEDKTKLVGDTYYVRNSNQIKLADGTNTTFDGSNPDIRYGGGGETKKYRFKIDEDDDGDRTTIKLPNIGSVTLVQTYPEYEFIDDIDENTLEELGVEEGDTIGKIEHLHIEDEYKGQGYAKVLMNEAIRLAKKKQLNPIYLNASPMGTKGLGIKDLTKFYESFGFEVFLEQGNNNLMLLNMENTPKAADGMLVGNSHAEGGIKINTPEGMIEAEGGEVIINKRSMASNEVVVCEGTPKQIASKINELEGGVQFDTGGSCEVVSTGEMVSESNTKPNEYRAEDGLSVSELNKPNRMKKYTITSVLDPNISWQSDEEDLLEYIYESQNDFDYVQGESIAESLSKMGLVLTTNVDIPVYEQAARGTVVRSSDPNVRPSPSVSATIFEIGTRMMGNDGNQWEITEDSRGVRRWKKVKYEDGGTMAADGMNVGQKSFEYPIMERMDKIDDSKELWTWFAKPEVSVDFYVEYETQGMESSTNRWDYRTENVYQETEMIDVPVVSGYEYIGVTDDSGEIIAVSQDMEEELREGLKGMYSKYLEGEEKENLYSGKIKGNHTFENGGPVNDFTQNVKDSLDALIGYMSTHDQKVRIHGSDYELDSMTPMYIRVTGGRGATYNIVPFFSKRGTGIYENAKYYSLTRGGVNKDFALLSDGRVMDIAEDGMDIAERGMGIRGLEVTGNQRRLQYDLEVLRDELKDEVITMDEYYEKRTELYKKYGIIKEDGGEFNANMGYLIATEKIQKVAPKTFAAIDEKMSKRVYSNGGGVEFIDYKGDSIMYEPTYKEFFVNDEVFDSLEKAKEYIDKGSPESAKTINAYRHGAFANGGGVGMRVTQKEIREMVKELKRAKSDKQEYQQELKVNISDFEREIIEEKLKLATEREDYFHNQLEFAIKRYMWSTGKSVAFDKSTYDFLKAEGFANGGEIKTDFNDLENTKLRNVLVSFWNDFSNGYIYDYLSIEKENYILSDIDNVFVIFRDKNRGDFSAIEKEKIDAFLSPYFDSVRKPLFSEFFDSYEIKDNKIMIHIKKGKMYSNGGGVGKKNAYDWLQENSDRILEYYLPGSAYDERITQNDLQEKGDYVIEEETGGDGAPQAFIEICFGDEYEKNVQQIEENYDSYARFLNKISDGEVLLDVQVLTNDESQTIMFLFTDSGYDSRNRKYANGGDMSYPRTGMKMVVFKKKVNPSVTITVKTYPNGQIVEIDNPMDIRFPFSVGQILNMGHRTWACSNGFMVNDQDPCGEEKIFGIRAKDIPQGHEFRSLYPHKFRK